MTLIHNLGLPRIGKQRELKFELEAYWQGKSNLESLEYRGQKVRKENRHYQKNCDFITVGDFSFYDHVLDMSMLLGHIPSRFSDFEGNDIDNYFRVARGRSKNDLDCGCVRAGEMTKWFDTNYHYIVPELTAETQFTLNPSRLFEQINEARDLGTKIKPVIIGPLSYLYLSKPKDGTAPLEFLDAILNTYLELFGLLAEQNIEWVQIDEPVLVTELDNHWKKAFEKAYFTLKAVPLNLLLCTYFGTLQDNLQLACKLPVAGLHIDTISAESELAKIVDWLPAYKILSLGVINGRNIWKSDLTTILDWLEPIAKKLHDRLWLAPSCSLLHVPIDLNDEHKLDPQIQQWLAFAIQKLDELQVLKKALNEGRASVKNALADNARAIRNRLNSEYVHNADVKSSVKAISPELGKRANPYELRAKKQKEYLKLPPFPTTTIGSFPQTQEIRKNRLLFKKGELAKEQYTELMREHIKHSLREQENLGLDVLVHGEAERNDMVEYFGEQLEGYAFSENGWVQSYGSRCVKPPILFGDIRRPHAMTVEWAQYAQSLTNKPVKGMLTGPVTILNWSFVRDDQPRSETCYQLALAIREEVLALEKAGVEIIQIDEAALREGLPLRQSDWRSYLDWAVESFRICANSVADETQIHTHMCYSEFNDIIDSIAHMDADVITIETSRSDMELLDVFDTFKYPTEIGPGVYDIHSPNIPTTSQIVELMKKAAERIPPSRLWVNPDCGLKTRQWHEVIPALKNMVEAASILRNSPLTN